MNKSILVRIILLLTLTSLILFSTCSRSEKESAPMGLGYHSMAYDPESRVTVLFGGQPREYDMTNVNTTWVYHSESGRWEKMHPQVKPPNSSGDTMAYDTESDLVILYSGQDIWVYDYNTDSWQQQLSPSPGTLWGAAMAYDEESDRMILFGFPSNETWAYDCNTDSWQAMHPDSAPPVRQYAAMAYDTAADRVVLYGGGTGIAPPDYTLVYDDTWLYDYNTNSWSAVATGKRPGRRVYHTMAYVPAIDRTVLFGGISYEDDNPADGELWLFDAYTGSWKTVAGEVSGFVPRRKHGMVFDSVLEALVVYGGTTATVNSNAATPFSADLLTIPMGKVLQ